MLKIMIAGLIFSLLVLIGVSSKLSKAMKNEDAEAKARAMPVLNIFSWIFKLCLLGTIILYFISLLK